MCAVFLSTSTDLNAEQNRGKDRMLPLKVTILKVSILSTGRTTDGKILLEIYKELKGGSNSLRKFKSKPVMILYDNC